jgi:UDP-N-acetylglucosamine 2-epimerase
MRAITIIGARPQFVKAYALIDHLTQACERHLVVHTGQHYDFSMSGAIFEELQMREPDINLEVGSGSHGEMTALMLQKIEAILLAERPDWVVVLGDTNSTLAGALAAAKLGVRVAHIEAGLRSFDRSMPEEINRVLTDHVSTYLACPSAAAVANLAAEGITRGVTVCGDLMLDAIARVRPIAESRVDVLRGFGLTPEGYVLATVHRAASTDTPERLAAVLECLAASPLPVLFPVHPRTRAKLAQFKLSLPSNVIAVDPVPYIPMVALERFAAAILTDSGGVQKEAYWLGVPCVTLRPSTEWIETVAEGRNVLVDLDASAVRRALGALRRASEPGTAYGTVGAGERIVRDLVAGMAS